MLDDEALLKDVELEQAAPAPDTVRPFVVRTCDQEIAGDLELELDI